MKITVADPSDSDRIREIYLRAFDETERETVAELAIALLSEESEPRPVHHQRFGFTRELAEKFLPPYPPRYPLGWQALRLDAREFPDEPVSIECVGALCLPEIW
jgi:predicted N-acetyltransferase YhbS